MTKPTSPLTMDGMLAKWEARRAEHDRLHTLGSIAAICEEVLADFGALRSGTGEATVRPAEAALATGYSLEQVRRWIRKGQVKNYGTPRRPRIRLSECPTKGKLPTTPDVVPSGKPGASSSPQVIALDVLASRRNARPRSA